MRVSTVNFTLFENLKGPKVRIYSLVWQPEHFVVLPAQLILLLCLQLVIFEIHTNGKTAVGQLTAA